MILDNLRKAGVQNTVKNERLTFDRLDPFAGDVDSRRRASTPTPTARPGASPSRIGPEYGTVGPQQVKEAAKEAVKGVGFDLLLVCGFAFDPHVVRGSEALRQADRPAGADEPRPGDGRRAAEEDRRRQPVHGLRRAGHRRSSKPKDGKLVVEINGVDVYDPTTGEIRIHRTDDIACWFIDTDYNGESFFVRHAYFTGADEPYDKLKRALRAEIDEAAWATLYSTVSRPFDAPDDRQDRREGHQPLRRRGAEGVRRRITYTARRYGIPPPARDSNNLVRPRAPRAAVASLLALPPSRRACGRGGVSPEAVPWTWRQTSTVHRLVERPLR